MNKNIEDNDSVPVSPPLSGNNTEAKKHTNLESARSYLGSLAVMLRDPQNPHEREVAIDVVSEMLERMANGEDPAWAGADGHPKMKDLHARAIVHTVEIRKRAQGITTHAAIKSMLADWPDMEFEQVRSIYRRNVEKYPLAPPGSIK